MNKQEQAIHLVDIWLDGIQSISRDAGWSGDSMLSRVIEFGGQPPKGTGMDQSNLAMINAIRFLKQDHHEFRAIDNVIKNLLRDPGTAAHIIALLVKRHYQGLNERTDKTYTRDDRAMLWFTHCKELGIKGDYKGFEEILSGYRYGSERCGPRLIWRDMKLAQAL